LLISVRSIKKPLNRQPIADIFIHMLHHGLSVASTNLTHYRSDIFLLIGFYFLVFPSFFSFYLLVTRGRINWQPALSG